MTSEEVIKEFRESGGLLFGHFVYTSGRHGNEFLQAARILQYPDRVARLCKAMADKFRDADIDLVAGPATGGIIIAYETARQLGCRGVFLEKDDDGGMELRRGFHLKPGTRVLVVEDIITTGGTVKKAITHLRERGAEVVGLSVLIDRSAGKANFDCPFMPLASMTLDSWPAEECGLCESGEPLVEPDDIIV